MKPSGTTDCCDVVYPPDLAGSDGWKPSTVTTPISPLEFDLRAKPFVDGFGRALRDMLGPGIEVGVRRSGGHLLTLVRRGLPSTAAETEFDEPDDFRRHWLSRVRPHTTHALDRLSGATQHTAEGQIAILEAAAGWIAELTYLHHTLLLPARVALGEFAEFVVEEGLLPSEVAALSLVAGNANATTTAARQLWQMRDLSAAGPACHGLFLDALYDFAQEGEGYGLQHPGWMEEPVVPLAVATTYATGRPDCAPDERLRIARQRRRALERVVNRRIARCGKEVGDRFRRLRRRARSATTVTEDHAPLMHARLGYELRRLVLDLGNKLARAGAIEAAGDVLLLHLDELVAGGSVMRERAIARRSELDLPLPTGVVTARTSDEVPDPFGSSRLAGYVRHVFGARTQSPSVSPGILSGESASSGRVTARVRRVRLPSDLAAVRPGELLVTPSNSAVWSFALPIAAGVVASGGSRFGHLASLARDYARPAVVALDRLDRLRDGHPVEVDGDAGTVVVRDP